MTRNRRHPGRLAAAGVAFPLLLTLALSGCGGGSGGSSAGSTPSISAQVPVPANVQRAVTKLVDCLSAQGVTVPSPVTRRGLRATIRDLPTAKRSSVIAGCQQQITALLSLRGQGKRSTS